MQRVHKQWFSGHLWLLQHGCSSLSHFGFPLGLSLTFTRNLRCGENLRPQHPVPFRRSSDVSEGSGEGGGVSEGLLGAPLYAISNSTNSRSCKTTPYSTSQILDLTFLGGGFGVRREEGSAFNLLFREITDYICLSLMTELPIYQ